MYMSREQAKQCAAISRQVRYLLLTSWGHRSNKRECAGNYLCYEAEKSRLLVWLTIHVEIDCMSKRLEVASVEIAGSRAKNQVLVARLRPMEVWGEGMWRAKRREGAESRGANG